MSFQPSLSAPASSGFGFRADTAAQTSRGPYAGIAWRDDASDPFGRAASTQACFARNGGTATTNRPLFERSELTQTQTAFNWNASGTGKAPRLFGDSSQQPPPQQTFGSRNSNAFLFGYSASQPSPPVFGSPGAVGEAGKTRFGTSSDSSKPMTTSCFGQTSTASSTGFGSGRPQFTTVFGTGGSTKPSTSSAGNPFTGSAANPFAKAASTVPQTENPFVKPAVGPFGQPVTANPFAKATENPFRASTVNPFAAKVARETATSSVNPFATKSTPPNPFAMSQGSSLFGQTTFTAGDGDRSQAKAPEPFKWTGFKFNSAVNTEKAFGNPTSSGQSNANSWAFVTEPKQKSPPATQTQDKSPSASVWSAWKTTYDSAQSSAASSATSTSVPSAPTSTVATTAAPEAAVPTTLVASPDVNPYGSGSCGDGLLELKVKTATSKEPSTDVLKVLESRSLRERGSFLPRPQPSARFASRLGLARQTLHVVPMKPVQPRFPSRHRPNATTPPRSKGPQSDVFCFSSAFSRLALSKRSLKICVSPTPAKAAPSIASDRERRPSATGTELDNESSSHESACPEEHESGDESAPSGVCPVVVNDEYFTVPSISELQQLTEEELSRVENFVIGRHGCGKISFVGPTDVRGLKLDSIVKFSHGEVIVYPEEDSKPEVNCELNKPAVVFLEGLAPGKEEELDPFVQRLEKHTKSFGATFLGYDTDSQGSGVWSFRVEHF